MKTKTANIITSAGLGLLFGASAASAQTTPISANFTGGNGTASFDQYTGVAGGGWASAWNVVQNTVEGTQTIGVANTSPVSSGGNYLSFSNTGTNGGNNLGLNRTWDTNTFSATAAPFRISFDLRIDSVSGWNSTNDYITLSTGGSGNASPGGGSTFIIRAYGANIGTAVANTWAFYNGGKDGLGFNTSLFISSGMAVTSGTTYKFTIDLNPAALTYVATINNGTTSISSAAMGYRTNLANKSTFQINSMNSAPADTFAYSLDSVGITVIPEPSSYAALGGFGAIGLALYRRRRRCV